MPYSLQLALQSLFREKWINLLSALTIAAGLLIAALAFLVGYNLDAATRKLPEKFSMTLYLEDNLPKEKIDEVVSSLKKNAAVSSVRFIPKEEALREMKALLKNSNYVFEGLDDNPLPDALEVKLRKDAVGPEAARKLRAEALKTKGVKEAEYGEKFLSALHSFKTGVTMTGMILMAILGAGIIFVCYSTVKILFYRRSEEIETFKLLGATKGFIRAPFIIEGAVIGAAGGIISLSCVFALYYFVLVRMSDSVPMFKAVLFPFNLFLFLPALGIFLGVTGAAVALGRLKY